VNAAWPLGVASKLTAAAQAVLEVGKEAGERWVGDACYRLGAALAYYALFSIFPLMLLAVTVVGFVLGGDAAARQSVLNSVPSPSPEFRVLLDQTLQSMQSHRSARGVGAVVGLIALILGASGVFSELESSLDLIWRVKRSPARGLWQILLNALRSKALSFVVVIVAAMAVLASLAVSTILAAVGDTLGAAVGDGTTNGAAARTLWQPVEMAVSLAFLAALFAAIYRLVPQADVQWRDVVGAALITSLFFVGLKSLLAWCLARIAGYAAYGAVGAVLGLLTWIYVASLVLFYGAEFSRVYAERYGSLAAQRAPDRS
jgi:membrane protein